tara:strand:+ start:1977 stop:2459 length:483 start_codon:yes stop_codon:yes gene_type:complete
MNPLVKISSSGKGIKKVLYFLPSEKEQAQIIAYLIKRNYSDDSFQFRYVFHEKSLMYYQNIPLSKVITFNDNDINWLGVLSSKFNETILGETDFDALVDLNMRIDQPLSLYSIHLKIPIKIGFQSPISHQLFSIVLEPSEDNFKENSYMLIDRILGTISN